MTARSVVLRSGLSAYRERARRDCALSRAAGINGSSASPVATRAAPRAREIGVRRGQASIRPRQTARVGSSRSRHDGRGQDDEDARRVDRGVGGGFGGRGVFVGWVLLGERVFAVLRKQKGRRNRAEDRRRDGQMPMHGDLQHAAVAASATRHGRVQSKRKMRTRRRTTQIEPETGYATSQRDGGDGQRQPPTRSGRARRGWADRFSSS